MDTDDERWVASILAQIEFVLHEPIDFTSVDHETSLAKVRLLTAAATYFNVLAVRDYGGRGGLPRDARLVEQAVGAAFQVFDGFDPRPDPFDKAAMLLRGITQGHPFYDGNKRTGFLLASYYLSLTDSPMPANLATDRAISLCLRISAGELRDMDDIAGELRTMWEEP